jgi:hypothetical protein
MRDINALKRTRTFIEKETYNSIRVSKNKLAYYCYADIFKEYIKNIPYYFGNSDIMISHKKFEELKDIFILKSLKKYGFLNNLLSKYFNRTKCNFNFEIDSYFKELLGEHYVDFKY